ncbi:MAG TPA: hypothetical protein VLA24_09480 [Pseudomonadales bacterium]|nr:hypothetical protein [Pseudomonadales bacterium]
MSNTEKRPLAQVEQIALSLCEKLAPACERIELAGSIRRRQPMVGDIEIIAAPRLLYDLLGEPMNVSEVDTLLALWPIALVKNGQKYKKFLFTGSAGNEYQVDLFLQPDPATWGINYMIRTGSADFSRRMVTPRRHGGMMPDHLRVKDARVWNGDEPLATPEETDVFELWGMTFVDPEKRS